MAQNMSAASNVEPAHGTLHRGLSAPGVVALSVSDITPMASLLIIAPVVMAVAGTASVWAYLVGCLLAICVAFCMGELGSMYPVAGGLYSIIHRVLGRPLGFLALVDYIAQGASCPPRSHWAWAPTCTRSTATSR